MFEPNQYTLTKGGVEWGLHKWPDGDTSFVCIRHRCGDWQTSHPSTQEWREWFEREGIAVPKKERKKETPSEPNS